MNTEEKALVYSVLTEVEYFLDLIKRKQGRGKQGMEVSKLRGFPLINFKAYAEPDPCMSFLAKGIEGNYLVKFSEEGVELTKVEDEEGVMEPMGVFPYEEIKGSDGELLLDPDTVRQILQESTI